MLGGSKTLADITTPYDKLVTHHGVRLVKDMVVQIDPDKRVVRLAGGSELPYDRLILSPGEGKGSARLEGRRANRGLAQAARSHA